MDMEMEDYQKLVSSEVQNIRKSNNRDLYYLLYKKYQNQTVYVDVIQKLKSNQMVVITDGLNGQLIQIKKKIDMSQKNNKMLFFYTDAQILFHHNKINQESIFLIIHRNAEKKINNKVLENSAHKQILLSDRAHKTLNILGNDQIRPTSLALQQQQKKIPNIFCSFQHSLQKQQLFRSDYSKCSAKVQNDDNYISKIKIKQQVYQISNTQTNKQKIHQKSASNQRTLFSSTFKRDQWPFQHCQIYKNKITVQYISSRSWPLTSFYNSLVQKFASIYGKKHQKEEQDTNKEFDENTPLKYE